MFHRSMRISLASLYALSYVVAPPMRAAEDPKEIVRRALRIKCAQPRVGAQLHLRSAR
jgi:hypothetical protein